MSVIRPVFRERQVLGAADFAAEQSARIDQLAGHAGAAHLAGVAAGLALLLDGDIVEAAPGVAILPSGRMPCVDMILRLDAPSNNGAYPIAIRAEERSGQRGPATHGVLAFSDEDFGEDEVVLGTVECTSSGLSITGTGRRWLGARAARVEAPDGSAALALGQGLLRPQPELSVAFGATPVLKVDAQRGGRLSGRLEGRPGPATAGADARAVVFTGTAPPPDGPAPWSLRRVAAEVDGRPVDDLRLELQHPGFSGDPVRSRLTIGNAQNHLALDAEGTLTLFRNGMRAEAGITVEPPGRVAFAPVSPGPTDPAFAATLTDAMLQGVAWALLIATLNSGVTGTVTINGTPAAGITVHREAAETVSDAKGRFYLAAVGWPGEAVILEFESDGDLLGSRPATVGATPQTFTFVIDGFGEDII